MKPLIALILFAGISNSSMGVPPTRQESQAIYASIRELFDTRGPIYPNRDERRAEVLQRLIQQIGDGDPSSALEWVFSGEFAPHVLYEFYMYIRHGAGALVLGASEEARNALLRRPWLLLLSAVRAVEGPDSSAHFIFAEERVEVEGILIGVPFPFSSHPFRLMDTLQATRGRGIVFDYIVHDGRVNIDELLQRIFAQAQNEIEASRLVGESRSPILKKMLRFALSRDIRKRFRGLQAAFIAIRGLEQVEGRLPHAEIDQWVESAHSLPSGFIHRTNWTETWDPVGELSPSMTTDELAALVLLSSDMRPLIEAIRRAPFREDLFQKIADDLGGNGRSVFMGAGWRELAALSVRGRSALFLRELTRLSPEFREFLVHQFADATPRSSLTRLWTGFRRFGSREVPTGATRLFESLERLGVFREISAGARTEGSGEAPEIGAGPYRSARAERPRIRAQNPRVIQVCEALLSSARVGGANE